jgi:hypothetical protein
MRTAGEYKGCNDDEDDLDKSTLVEMRLGEEENAETLTTLIQRLARRRSKRRCLKDRTIITTTAVDD